MPRSRRLALAALAFAALVLGTGCTSSFSSACRSSDASTPGHYMAASDGLGRSVESAAFLDRQERIRVANVPTE
ncbi:MAG TPA: hypothetical protein PKE29_06860 [Phycisphaerales bacterium]|nr:hypothetical protein [Phycisphaerales bacterium]